MKELFPQRCIVCIPGLYALERFVQYCEILGVDWDAGTPMRIAMKFIGAYLKSHGDTCINMHRDGGEIRFGYCYAGYYGDPHYVNLIDPKWNFCSVEQFIDWTGGWLVDDPMEEVNLDTIL